MSATDNPDYCAPNAMISPFCWTIFVDDSVPDARPINPLDGDYVACDSGDQYIAIYLYDEYGIVADSIEIRVDGVTIEFAGGEISYGDTVLSYIPPEPWEDGDTVVVQLLRAPDSLGNPVEPISYSFYMDLSPPEIYSMAPATGDTISGAASIIRCGLLDRISGLDTSSITFSVGGFDYGVGDIPGPIWIAGGIDRRLGSFEHRRRSFRGRSGNLCGGSRRPELVRGQPSQPVFQLFCG